ncbi:MAG: CPBP family intramembrane metalloprotease [Firmicutes bacterium]|nr:CPBP family intramembrane metalloprotease [Bacillota bacterium]MBQ4187922.1 CPBP family intramembrane metalloprotease [Bacillota bacterium]
MRYRLQSTNIFAIAVLVAYSAVSVVASAVIALRPDMPFATVWVNTTVYLVGFGLPCLIMAILLKYRQGQPLKETFSIRPLPILSILICIVLGITLQTLSSLIAQISAQFFNNLTDASITSMTVLPLPLLVFAMAILPALFEEMLCRGVLFDGYKEAPAWYQIVLPACFFGFLHMNFQQISYALPMGIILALVVYYTRSIFASIIIHFIVNGTQVTISWLAERKGMFAGGVFGEDLLLTIIGGTDNFTTNLIAAGIALVVTVLLLLALRKIHNVKGRGKRVPAPKWHKGGWIMYFALGYLFLNALVIEFLMPFMNELLNQFS